LIQYKKGWSRFSKRKADVNFTNISQAAFLYENFCAAFMCLQFGFVSFWQKDFGAKAAHKMLVKLTPDWLVLAPKWRHL
jgi:hypothetical protein